MSIREKIFNGIKLATEEVIQFWFNDNVEGFESILEHVIEQDENFLTEELIIQDTETERYFSLHSLYDYNYCRDGYHFYPQTAIEVEPREKIEWMPIKKEKKDDT